MILLPLLLLLALGGGLLAPLIAAHLALLADRDRRGRWADWFGLSVGLELTLAFMPLALACALFGPVAWAPYRVAWAFAVAGPALGYVLVRLHARHLRGDDVEPGRAGLACLGFAVALGFALLPWLMGAPLPLAGGGPGAGQPVAGDARAYVTVLGPVALVLLTQAWLLRRRLGRTVPDRRGWPEAATALALVGLVVVAPSVLPRSHWNPRRVAADERAALRAQAAQLDEPRRKALAAILTGRGPAVGTDECPLELPDWQAVRRFATPAKRLADLTAAGAVWAARRDVAPCSVNVATDLDRWSAHLDGPRRRHVARNLDEAAWQGPWPEGDVMIAADQARRRVRARAGLDGWEVDATLLISEETPSFSAYGKSNLGSLEATLWLWSYAQQAFVCAGKSRVGYAVLDEGFDDAHASAVRAALRMRGLALAAAELRAIVR